VTSGKAIVSLVFGFLPFPLSIVAIVYGHLSLSEIRRSAGRLKGEGLAMAGLVLGYLGIVVIPVILIIAAIAIPNLLRARMAANEASAAAGVRTIVTAETNYASSHPDLGYICSLSDLGRANLVPPTLASGIHNGYGFEISGCTASAPGGTFDKFHVVAYPMTKNQTGVRAFCADESAVINVDGNGSAQACLESGSPLR
jgi:competence protein ComGC